ncbi:MAG: glycosyltransferase [Methanobacterium paludis]|nr:glycosyltransferase [Methanobacterium paludis]
MSFSDDVPRVAVIILNWNGWEDTIECLESLYQINYPNYQVILVDNASTDDSIQKIKEYCQGTLKPQSKFYTYQTKNKPIKITEYSTEESEAFNGACKTALPKTELHPNKNMILIKNTKNYGFAEGNNIGIRYALRSLNQDYTLLLNNDTVVDKNFLTELVKTAESSAEIGVVGPKIYYYDTNGRTDMASNIGGVVDLSSFPGYYDLSDVNPAEKYKGILECDWVSGEDKILFSCDFFGSHFATSDIFVTDEAAVYTAAKKYYAEIMMPFRINIQKNLEKLKDIQIEIIAPSHGPLYNNPEFILDAYKEWISDDTKNEVIIPYTSMHGSTQKMVEHLVDALIDKGISVKPLNLAVTDIGDVALALVDASTMVIASPTVLIGPHPNVVYATYLANALRPKLKFISVIGSYGWGGRMLDQITGILTNLKAEILEPVIIKGFPKEEDFKKIDVLADEIVKKHAMLK